MAGDRECADGTMVRVKVSFVLILSLLSLVPVGNAQTCTAQNCRPPDCFCKGGDIPGGLSVANTPQMIMLTFDDAVNQAYFPLYQSLYTNKLNPDGCPSRGTFYVCHDYSNYQMIQKLYDDGHEIASHSISHRLPSNWWSSASTEEWSEEIEGQREILASWTNIPKSEIRGMRAPYLSVGGDEQFQMISSRLADNFVYDSSVVSRAHGDSAFISPTWPYTMDYPPTDECLIGPCPSQSFPGVWEIPLVSTQTESGRWCSMEDECTSNMSENEIYDYFLSNFERHYTSNRAPFGIFLHGPFLEDEARFQALNKFMTDVSRRGDVFFVTAWQVIQWMKNPVTLAQINNYFCPIRQTALQCPEEQANFCLYDAGASLVNRKKRSASGFFGEQSFVNQTDQGNQTVANAPSNQTFTNQTNSGNQTFTNQTNSGNQTFTNQTNSGNQTFTNQTNPGNQTFTNQTNSGNQTFTNQTNQSGFVLSEYVILEGQTLINQSDGNQTVGNLSTNAADDTEFDQQVIVNQTDGNQTTSGNQTTGNQTAGNQVGHMITDNIEQSSLDKFSLKYLGSARNSHKRPESTKNNRKRVRRSLRPKRQAYNGWHNMYTCKPCPQSYPWLGNSQGL